MRSRRRIRAALSEAARSAAAPVPSPGAPPGEGAAPGPCGVDLVFVPRSGRLGVDRIHHHLPLGPELTVDVALALAGLARLLRAARVAPPRDLHVLLGAPERALRLLERAIGSEFVLELVPRSRVSFAVWTDAGVEHVSDVTEVVEDESAWLVHRHRGKPPVRVPRDSVIRQRTWCETWFEIVEIDRAASTSR